MPLQALLAGVHPAWFEREGEPGFDHELLALARRSALGQRLLVRALPVAANGALLAPRPGGGTHPATIRRWPRARIDTLVRDLGVLAFAPLIRAEVRREPVRWLRKVLGNSYLLALDRTVWDGRIERGTQAHLSQQWEALVADPGFLSEPAVLGRMLDRHGCGELRAWASRRDPPLAEWTMLLLGDAPREPAHLPDRAVLAVVSHHETRDLD